ncbi:MAG: zinc ribbon domain-containing protein [Bacilli bacterium]|nr:zinc ribbon domain-containing protein [Bacilli bacterium]
MEQRKPKIPCPKCGELMYADARYCMRCGTINTANESNKALKKAVQQSINSYKAGKTPLINEGNTQTAIASNTGNRKFAFMVTYFLYLGIILLTGIATYLTGINSFDLLIISTYPMTVLLLSVFFIYIYSIELIFMKCNKPWWAGLVPIYNVMELGDIAFHNKYVGLITLIPGVGILFLLAMFYKIGDRFNYNAFITMILSLIYIPVIGFSDHLYEGKAYVSSNDDRSLEKDYRNKKIFFTTAVLLLLGAAILLVMGNMGKLRKTHQSISDVYFVLASQRTIKAVKKAVEEDRIECDNVKYNSTEGIYYLRYNDVSDIVHLPFYMLRDPIGAYIKIDNTQKPRVYYISMSDGSYGFKETIEGEVTKDIVTEYPTLDIISNKNVCIIK